MKLRARDLYWGISDFKKSYRPRNNIAKDDKGDLVIDCHSILARWRKHFSQLLNVHEVNDVPQTEIHTAEPLVPDPSTLDIEIAIEKLKRHKSPGIDQIPAELTKAGGRKIRSEINKFINPIWNKEEWSNEWKESIIIPIYKKGGKTNCSNYNGISLLTTTYRILPNILLSKLTPYAEEIIGDHQCGFRSNKQGTVQIICLRQILGKNGNTVQQYIYF